ncbi:MAG: NAD-dependent epimerase/dehydratase family protein [Chloroflexi bacterium]|nr:NAD-dependent epimerase/dehydratase family protein [Chloroflexota bacterium]
MEGTGTDVGRRIVVTGGAGFIGTSLVRALASRGAHVVVLDDGRAAGLTYLGDVPVEIVRDALVPAPPAGSLERLLDGADAIVHLAARPGVPASITDPTGDRRANVDTTLALLDAARRADVPRFIFASSNAAVGAAAGPISESTLPRPTSPYGAAKLAVEGYLHAYAGSYGIATLALRFANAYGPYSLHKRSVVASFLLAGLRGRPLTVHGDGRQGRDMVHVDDLVALIVAALDAEPAVVAGRVLQAGSGRLTTIAQLAEAIAALLGEDGRVERAPPRAGDVSGAACDVSAGSALLGWTPNVTLEEGLGRTAAWFRAALADPTLAPLADD